MPLHPYRVGCGFAGDTSALLNLIDYKVSFGKVTRILVYEDSLGSIRFTFDIGSKTQLGQSTIVLEHPGRSSPESDERRISTAMDRVREYLVSCGYNVEIYLG
jgi:hypothetical protein